MKDERTTFVLSVRENLFQPPDNTNCFKLQMIKGHINFSLYAIKTGCQKINHQTTASNYNNMTMRKLMPTVTTHILCSLQIRQAGRRFGSRAPAVKLRAPAVLRRSH